MQEHAIQNLETRLAALENEFAAFRIQQQPMKQNKNWRKVLGMFTGDEYMREVDAAGAAIRQADRDAMKDTITENPEC